MSLSRATWRDELLDGPAVEIDQPSTGVEVPGEQLADFVCVAGFRKGRESDQVGKQDRHQPALGPGSRRWAGHSVEDRGGLALDGSPALVAELGRRPDGVPIRADSLQRPAAFGTELRLGPVLGAAVLAG
jgi:hypothetical protein